MFKKMLSRYYDLTCETINQFSPIDTWNVRSKTVTEINAITTLHNAPGTIKIFCSEGESH